MPTESELNAETVIPIYPQDHKFGTFPNRNPGDHVFRYSPRTDMQRRCARCGIWETSDSRMAVCQPKWIGVPWNK